jgi:hypothetical protein
VNVLQRWSEEELARVPRGPTADELRRRVRVRRTRRVGSLATIVIVMAVLGIAALLQSPTAHRVSVTEPASSTAAVPTGTTLPLATADQVPPLAKITNSVVGTVQTDIDLKAIGHESSSAEIVLTTQGRADALTGGGSSPRPNQPMFLVQVVGDFVCNDCMGLVPYRPHGTSFQALFDRAGNRDGFSIGAKQPFDLSSIGTPYRLSLARPSATTARFPQLAKMARVASNFVGTDDRPRPGAAHPTSAEIVETTRARAFPLFGGSTSALGEHIYIVQVIGNFVCDECSRPAGAVAPHGRGLRVFFDGAGNGYGFGVGPPVYDLSKLGTVYGLPLSAPTR